MPSIWELLTLRGRIVFIIGIFTTIATVILGQRPMMWMGIALLFIPLVPVIFMRRTHINLTIHRQISPALTPLGSELTGTLIVDKGNNLTGGVALFQETVPKALGSSPRFTLHQIGGQSHRELSYRMRGTRRGRYTVGPILMEMRDPFGMVRVLRGQMNNTHEVFITPQIHLLTSGASSALSGSTGEASPQQVSSMGEDDVLVREYVQGDDMRRIHWRSTAKTGEFMVRREEQSLDPSAIVIIDNRASAHTGSSTTGSFEWAVSAAASIAIHLIEQGYRIDLVSADGMLVTARPGPETATARQEILEAMTDITTTTEITLALAARAAGIAQHGQLVYAVLGNVDAHEAEIISHARGNHGNASALLPDTSTFSPSLKKEQWDRHREEATLLLLDSRWGVVPATKESPMADLWSQMNRGRQ